VVVVTQVLLVIGGSRPVRDHVHRAHAGERTRPFENMSVHDPAAGGGAVPARDARSGPARTRSSQDGDRSGRVPVRPSARRSTTGQGNGAPSVAPDEVVVGTVPVGARVAGVLLALAGLVAVVALVPTYLVIGGTEVSPARGFGSVLLALLVPVADIAVGLLLARGAVPKFGLAYAAVGGALSVGQLLIELYRGSSSTSRPGVEVVAGEKVLTSSVEVGAGWVLGLIALGLTVLAGVCAALAWGRTVMDDGGTLDPIRSTLAGAAVLVGVATVLCLSLPAADVPDRIVTDPTTGLETVVTQEGPQALLERPGLALLGGLLLAGAVLLCSVVAPSLRPRLATVGGLLALAVTVLDAGLTGVRDAASSAELQWTLPGAALMVAGLAYVLLTVVAWRARRTPPSARV
jgi:hypothetical protein